MHAAERASLKTLDGVIALERATGIPSATLRVWERRYGFPHPVRDARGHRTYDGLQVQKLQLIAQLMARGGRPGHLVTQSLEQLQAGLAEQTPGSTAAGHDVLLHMLRSLDTAGVMRHLLQKLTVLGVDRFVVQVVASANTAVGAAWSHGLLQPREEHLYTECLQQVLHGAMLAVPPPTGGGPRVLLATPHGEQHWLGLLMVQALLKTRRAPVLGLGRGLSADQIAAAATAWQADIVALSVTDALAQRLVLGFLRDLRHLLPADIQIWAGGSSRALRQTTLLGDPRLRVFDGIEQLTPAVEQFQSRNVLGQTPQEEPSDPPIS